MPSVAGSETTASTLAALTNNLLRYPDVYAKLKAEIRGTFATEDEIKLATVNELPYLTACIEEGLRIFPPAPIGFLRSIQPGGDTIDGHHIPGGVSRIWSTCLVYQLIYRDLDCSICQLLVRTPY